MSSEQSHTLALRSAASGRMKDSVAIGGRLGSGMKCSVLQKRRSDPQLSSSSMSLDVRWNY
jgi:hypothetical protein